MGGDKMMKRLTGHLLFDLEGFLLRIPTEGCEWSW